jgi:hypothetical protein
MYYISAATNEKTDSLEHLFHDITSAFGTDLLLGTYGNGGHTYSINMVS